jgi:CpeT protein
MKKLLFNIILICISLTAAAQQPADEYMRLCTWMTGSFSSAQQAAVDTAYLDIRLHMVPVFKDRTDGYWLYVEQAVATSVDKPYRQRVYQVVNTQRGLESIVYEIADPLRFAGGWKNAELLKGLQYEMLDMKEGCSILLRWNPGTGTYEGRTGSGNCPSNLQGAAYATSEVMILPTRLVSWDRGFDAQGKQVWGAEKGGYQFLKVYEK